MLTLLLAAALAQEPPALREEARELVEQLAEAEAYAPPVEAFIARLDTVAPPEDGASPTTHEAMAALALVVQGLATQERDLSVLDDAVRAQIVRRTALQRDFDARSVDEGAVYREALADAVVPFGRDARTLCVELRALRARYETGQTESTLTAVQALVEAYRHPYDRAVAQHLVGQLLLKQGDASAALPWLESARDVYDPDDRRAQHAPTLDRAILWSDLAMAYDATGDERSAKRARRELKRARRLGPSDSLWERDQERLTVVLDDRFNGTCWDGDAWWNQLEGE